MKITVLVYADAEGKHDEVADQVAAALKESDHQVSILEIHDDVRKLISGLKRLKPSLVFNLVETFEGVPRADVVIAAVLDILRIPYTGGGPGELYLRQDKGLAKKVLAFDKILFPDFAVFTKDADLETGGNLRMPLFVKPLQNDASIGIDGDSLVRDATSLMKKVISIHEKQNDSALVEEYVDGREFYVGVLGNRDAVALPPIEMVFDLPEGAPRILGSRAKWVKSSVEYKGTQAKLAELPDDLRAKLQKVSLDAYRALKVRDYGRVDLRLTDTLDIYVIEVNANCYLEQTSEFTQAAKATGMEYAALVNRIVELAVERSAGDGSGKRPDGRSKPAKKPAKEKAAVDP